MEMSSTLMTFKEAREMLTLAGVTAKMWAKASPWKRDVSIKDVLRGEYYREVAAEYFGVNPLPPGVR
jgi:hypothetical protein